MNVNKIKDKKLKSKLKSQLKSAFAEADASPKCFISVPRLREIGGRVKKGEAIYFSGDEEMVLRFKKDLEKLEERIK